MIRLVACLALVACGSGNAPSVVTAPVRPLATTAADRILALLPEGAQLVVEVDLARLRANAAIGPLVTQVLTGEGLPPLPADVPMSPLARADALVLASYGVGTAQAATVVILDTDEAVPGSVRLQGGLVALGPEAWTAQLEARAAIALDAGAAPITASRELLALRDHAMPPNAPGASLRITARLPFDARIALARETGLEAPPAQLSIWADVVDDLAIIVDADAADPGDGKAKRSAARLEAELRGVLEGLAALPPVRALGLPPSITRARITSKGTWVRAIIAVGPAHLRRVVERASSYLSGAS